MDRRSFLRTTVAASPFLATSRSLGAKYGQYGDFKKRVALIGSGWYGKIDLLRLIQVAPVDVVGLCDVDSRMLSEAADLVATRQLSKKRPPTFANYQELLEKQKPDIVLIDTPDHWHALPAIDAINAGADLYLQKPISVDIAEGQAILDAARAKGRVVQVGTQRRSTPHLMDAKKQVVDAGLLGKVAHAEICCYYHMRSRTPAEKALAPVPDHLDWEAWTGPAPMRPFNKVAHPRGWRAFKEYGNGIVGDMCIHMLDAVRWILDLGEVNRVSSSGGIYVDKKSIANIPDTQTATFDFDDLQVVWNHRTWGDAPDPEFPWAFFIYGEKGTLKADVHKWEFTPRGGGKKLSGKVKFELEEYPEDNTEEGIEKHVAPAVRVHMRDLLDRIADRGKPVADIEQGYLSTSACILANMSQELGRSLEWDGKARKINNDDEANKLLARPYRAPYVHPSKA
ncbi:Gfo/Idh/MocA family oxidoreductase [Akkermansiaceae bacterium]|nr:Gfo/Idh/MocA family oxidoreductase [Akkermansiaceae bacterium]